MRFPLHRHPVLVPGTRWRCPFRYLVALPLYSPTPAQPAEGRQRGGGDRRWPDDSWGGGPDLPAIDGARPAARSRGGAGAPCMLSGQL